MSELVPLLRREAAHSGVWFAGKLTEAADRIEALERELAEAREALVAEREETLWSAYSSGLEKDGRWTHMFMSDGEWLAREVGLDPRTGHYDAEYIKSAIPRAARAAIRTGDAEQ